MPFRIVPRRDRKLHRLFGEGREVKACRDAAVYAVGDAAEALYMVRDGYVRLTLPPNGAARPRTVGLAGPGEIFGLEAVLSSARRTFGAVAGEEAILVGISGAGTLGKLANTTWTLPLLIRALHTDLARARWSGPGAGGPCTVARLADLLLDLAQRMGRSREGTTEIPHWLTHQELADLIGGHRSTVTTQINEWIYAGLLREENHSLVIVDAEGLEGAGSGRKAWLDAVDPLSPST